MGPWTDAPRMPCKGTRTQLLRLGKASSCPNLPQTNSCSILLLPEQLGDVPLCPSVLNVVFSTALFSGPQSSQAQQREADFEDLEFTQ